MRVYREQDFDKMAERVVDRFMGGSKLADAAVGEAMEGSLNPDQIARLVHAANTMAFLRLMEQQKAQGGADMTSEFDPIDARQVMEQLIGATAPPGGEMGGPPHAEPDGDEGPLPNEMSLHEMGGNEPPDPAAPPADDGPKAKGPGKIDDDNDGPFPKGKKQKAKDDAEKKPKKEAAARAPDRLKTAAFRERRLRKFAETLEDQYRQAEWSFEDGMTRLSSCLRRASGAPSMEAFEKDALALHGDDFGVAVLNIVRGERGLPPLDFATAREKAAALADRHVVEDTEANSTFDQLVKIASEAARLRRGAEHVRSLCG